MPARPPITPSLFYADPAAALKFLEAAFGLETSMRVTDAKGAIMHAEMRYGDGLIMVGPTGWSDFAKSPKPLGGANTQSLHIEVEDIAAHVERARRAGAEIVAEPADQFYGDRLYRAIDCEGHQWSFSQHIRDVPVEEMTAATGLSIDMKP
jgi:uncharacterized glyoxalase superfamily protein PhnB